MNRYLFSLFLILALFVGCSHNKSDENLSPEEHLKIVSLKIDKHPNDATLRFERAGLLLQLERPNEAIVDMLKAVAADAKNVKYQKRLADAYFATGNVERSYAALEKALDLDPDDEEALLKLGEISYYSRDYDRALKHLTAVTQHDPNNHTALFLKSFIYKEMGDTASAVTLLNKCCELYPDDPKAFESLGVLYAQRKSPMALQYLQTALQLDPSNVNTLYALAMYYQDTRQYKEADETYCKIIDLDPSNAQAWHNRGYIQLFYVTDEEHFDRAADFLTKALQADSTCIEAWSTRATCYEAQGSAQMAVSDYRMALSFNPSYQPAIDGLSRLGQKYTPVK